MPPSEVSPIAGVLGTPLHPSLSTGGCRSTPGVVHMKPLSLCTTSGWGGTRVPAARMGLHDLNPPPHGGSTPVFGAGDASWSDTVGHTPGRGWVQGAASQNQTRSREHNRGHGLCAQIPPGCRHLAANVYKTPKFPFYGSDCPKSWLCCCWRAGAPPRVGSAPGERGQRHPDCVRSRSQRHQAASHRGAVELRGLAPKRPCQQR